MSLLSVTTLLCCCILHFQTTTATPTTEIKSSPTPSRPLLSAPTTIATRETAKQDKDNNKKQVKFVMYTHLLEPLSFLFSSFGEITKVRNEKHKFQYALYLLLAILHELYIYSIYIYSGISLREADNLHTMDKPRAPCQSLH